jgi:hypothetical protein
MCIEYGKYAQKTLYNVRSKLIFDRRIDIVTVYSLVSLTSDWQSAPSALRTSCTSQHQECHQAELDHMLDVQGQRNLDEGLGHQEHV